MADTINTTGIIDTGTGSDFALKIPDQTQLPLVKFAQDPDNPANLLATLPNGEIQSFPDYLALSQAGLPPALSLVDGTVIEGEDILALVDEINYDLLAPAAGPEGPNATGGGAGFTPYTSGLLGDQLNHGPFSGDPGGLPETKAPEYELHLATAVGGVVVDIDVIDAATGVAGGGYEDGQPNQHLGDDESSPMKVEVSVIVTSADTEMVSLTLSGIPEGFSLYVGGTLPGHEVPVTDGSYLIDLDGMTSEEQSALLDTIYLTGPEDSDTDFTLYAEALFSTPSGELLVPAETVVALDAVADMPLIPELEEGPVYEDIAYAGFDEVRQGYGDHLPPTDVPGSRADEPEPSAYAVSIAAVFDDVVDSSEHHMLFARVPDGWTLIDGSDGYRGTLEVTTNSIVYLGTSYPKTLAGLTDLLIDAGLETTDLSGLFAADGSAADGQLINLPAGVSYAMFYLTADEMVSNGDSPTSPSYTANVTLTLQAPDRWDMEEGEGWQVVGDTIGFVPEDTDGDGEADSGVMIGDSGVVEFNIPTYALAMDVPSETGTEITYGNNLSLVSAGTVSVTVDPVHGQLYTEASAGFEDGDSGDMIGIEAERQDAVEATDDGYVGYENDTGVPEGQIALHISFAIPDNEWLTQLEITGVRTDASVIAESGNITITNNGGGSWTLTPVGTSLTQGDLDGLAIQLNEMSDGETDDDTDMDLDVTARFYDPDTGHSLVRGGEILVTVDAVAEQAIILPPDPETGFNFSYSEDNPVFVPDTEQMVDGEPLYGIGFSAMTTDDDGSEGIVRIILDPAGDVMFSAVDDLTAINLVIDGQLVTEGAALQIRTDSGLVDATASFDAAGSLTLIFNPDDQIQRVDLTASDTDAGLQVRLPRNASMEMSIDAQVLTQETVTDEEITFENNQALESQTISLVVTPVNDPPVAMHDAESLVDHFAAEVTIPGADLLANDYDPDADGLTIIGIDDSNLVGATATLVDGNVVLTNDMNGSSGFGAYTLFVEGDADYGDTIATAMVLPRINFGPLLPGTPARGHFPNTQWPLANARVKATIENETDDDVNFYQIEMIAGETLIVDIDLAVGQDSLAPIVEIYDSAGTKVDEGTVPTSGNPHEPWLNFTPATDGLYFVKVFADTSAGDRLIEGSYEMNLTIDNRIDYPSEISGSFTYTITDGHGEQSTATVIVDDAMIGSPDADEIIGTDLADILQGLAGNDSLTGGGGNDVLIGGSGADEFIYTSMDDGDDAIYDFNPAADTINLDALFDQLGLLAGERDAVINDQSNWSGGADDVLKLTIADASSEVSITFDDLGMDDLDEVKAQIITDES